MLLEVRKGAKAMNDVSAQRREKKSEYIFFVDSDPITASLAVSLKP